MVKKPKSDLPISRWKYLRSLLKEEDLKLSEIREHIRNLSKEASSRTQLEVLCEIDQELRKRLLNMTNAKRNRIRDLEDKESEISGIRNDLKRQCKAASEDFYLQNIELLLALCPTHFRTSCSDDNPCNADRYCNRCKILRAKKEGYWDYGTISIEIH